MRKAGPEHQDIRDLMYERLGVWARRMSQRTTISDKYIETNRGASRGKGILLGLYDGSEGDAALQSKIRRKVGQDFTKEGGA